MSESRGESVGFPRTRENAAAIIEAREIIVTGFKFPDKYGQNFLTGTKRDTWSSILVGAAKRAFY